MRDKKQVSAMADALRDTFGPKALSIALDQARRDTAGTGSAWIEIARRLAEHEDGGRPLDDAAIAREQAISLDDEIAYCEKREHEERSAARTSAKDVAELHLRFADIYAERARDLAARRPTTAAAKADDPEG